MADGSSDTPGVPVGRNPYWDHFLQDKYPELGTGPISVESCTSQKFYELERDLIFSKTWLNVGRVEEIPQAGNFLVQDIAMCNTSVVVVRDKNGGINAFHNVCSHRLNKLVWEEKGTCPGFKCRFHAWAYKLDGTLVGVPGEGNFHGGIDKKKLSLEPIAVDTWQGFIFINLDPQPKQTLKEYLGELGEVAVGYPFAEKGAIIRKWRMEIACNWKLIKDAFKEPYHVNFMHKLSLRDSFAPAKNPAGSMLYAELFPVHQRGSTAFNPDYKPNPLEALAYQYGGGLISDTGTDSSAGFKAVVGTNPANHPDWAIDVHGIFPSFIYDTQQNSFFSYNLWPLAPDRTLWESRSYFPEAKNAAQRFSQEFSAVIFRDLITEDCSTLENTQQMLKNGVRKHFHFQDDEILLRHDHNVLHSMIAAGGDVTKTDGRKEQPNASA